MTNTSDDHQTSKYSTQLFKHRSLHKQSKECYSWLTPMSLTVCLEDQLYTALQQYTMQCGEEESQSPLVSGDIMMSIQHPTSLTYTVQQSPLHAATCQPIPEHIYGHQHSRVPDGEGYCHSGRVHQQYDIWGEHTMFQVFTVSAFPQVLRFSSAFIMKNVCQRSPPRTDDHSVRTGICSRLNNFPIKHSGYISVKFHHSDLRAFVYIEWQKQVPQL